MKLLLLLSALALAGDPAVDAARSGRAKDLKRLLKAGPAPASDVLAAAGESGDIATLKVAIKKWPMLRVRALEGAARAGKLEALTYLLDEGEKATTEAAIIAVDAGQPVALRLLMDRGADACGEDQPQGSRRSLAPRAYGAPAMADIVDALAGCITASDQTDALRHSTATLAALLARVPADPRVFLAAAAAKDWEAARLIAGRLSTDCAEGGDSLLVWTVENASPEARRVLLDAGAKPDKVCSPSGRAALRAAASKGDVPAAQALLAAGADPAFKSGPLPMSPLETAAAGDQLEMVDLLLKRGARKEQLDDALFAAVTSARAGVARRLIKEGAEPSALRPGEDAKPRTALAALAAADQPVGEQWQKTAAVLLKDKTLRRDPSPFVATFSSHAVHALVKAGLPADARFPEGHNALIPKLESGYKAGVYSYPGFQASFEQLLKEGADPDSGTPDGTTPLMNIASFIWGDQIKSLAALLLRHGADINLEDAQGRTARDRALERGQQQLAFMLNATLPKEARDKRRARAQVRPAPGARPADIRKMVKEAVDAEKSAFQTQAEAEAAPPSRLIRSDVDAAEHAAAEDPKAYAVVVGVEQYSELPKAVYAERDAEAVRRHLLAAGYPERNLITLTGQRATLTALKKYLQTWLQRNVPADGKVFVYFSGHGAPDPRTGDSYLVPWDGDPTFLDDTAYPLKTLYKTLEGLKARQVVVALDACFSGAGGRSVLPAGARPLVAKPKTAPPAGKLVVLSASQADQITNVLEDQGHGIFTYYFLKSLNAGARTPAAAYDFLKPRVQDAARRQNRDQTPALNGPASTVTRF